MRTVYYIIAPMASGKTTAAKTLSSQAGLQLFHADLVYNYLADKYNVDCPPAKLTNFTLWDNPQNFGISSWGEHATMTEAKGEAYRSLLQPAQGDFVIEGFTLSFPFERKLVRDAVGPHRGVIVRILMDFELWKSWYLGKFPGQPAPSQATLDRLLGVFSSNDPSEMILQVAHPSEINMDLISWIRA